MNGFIKEEDINEVRGRNDLVEVISEYVPLKKSGRTFKALCPFHKEKTPSFIVDPVKQLYHCFGCGIGGNVFTFIMKMDNIDFPDAVRALADRVGYTLHYERDSKESQSRRVRLYEANKEAMNFFYNLLKSEEGRKARKYLKNRGYDAEIIDAFKLGLAPSRWDGLLNSLCARGFKLDELEESGLIIKGEKGFYDRFRSRIMFPIFDVRGRVIAFGGRILDESHPGKGESPKYMNSPETPIYNKSSILYGLYHSKNGIAKTGQSLVVEGYTDVLSLRAVGIKNVVATCGTAFTSDHLRLLARFGERVILVFDADVAGTAAAERGLELLGESKVDIYVVSLPMGTDPADFVAEHGRSEFEKLLEDAVPLVDFCLKQVLSQYNLGESLQRAKASSEALTIIAALKGAVAQEEYLKKLAEELNVSFDSLFFELKRLKRSKTKRASKEVSEDLVITSAQEKAEQELLRLILQYPEEYKAALTELDEEHFTLPECRELFTILKSRAHYGSDEPGFQGILSNAFKREELQKLISKLMLQPVEVEEREKYFKDILLRLKEFEVQRQINTLKPKLERINPIKNPIKYDALFEELLKLEAKRRDLRGNLS
ncbi:MAG: DNA primase [Actinomycetota bacterium]